MKRFAVISAIPVIAIAALTTPTAARASGDGGAVAAGAEGGFIGGFAVGSALAPQPYYYGPDYQPYYQPAVHCYWTRGRPHWDALRGAWVRPRIRVVRQQ